jgi:YggT family protein
MCSITQLILIILQFAIWIVIASAILSWLYAFNIVNPSNQFVSMIGRALYQMTEPIYSPIRRFLPNLGGIDISPVIVIFIIIFLQMLVQNNMVPAFCYG